MKDKKKPFRVQLDHVKGGRPCIVPCRMTANQKSRLQYYCEKYYRGDVSKFMRSVIEKELDSNPLFVQDWNEKNSNL